MVAVSNVHIGLSAWAANQAVTQGARCSNGGNAYQCISSGTTAASGGPTGTGLIITDGTATWTWLSAINYTSMSAWTSSLPTTLSQPVVASLWNDALIQPNLAQYDSWISLTGITTSSANTITINCAPGESFRDWLRIRPQARALAWQGTTAGVAVDFTGSVGSSNYIYFNSPYITLDGLQIRDTSTSDTSTLVFVDASASNNVIQNCLIDGIAQAGGAIIVDIYATSCKILNSVLIDRQPSNSYEVNFRVDTSATLSLVNTTIAYVNTPNSGLSCIVNDNSAVNSVVALNCMSLNFPFGFNAVNTAGACSVSYSVLTSSTVGNQTTDGGNNLVSQSAASLIVSPYTDLRLKAGSPAINAGSNSAKTSIPTMDDIAGTKRSPTGPWDAGAWEFLIPIVYRRNLIRLRRYRDGDPQHMARRDWQRLADHYRDGYITCNNIWI